LFKITLLTSTADQGPLPISSLLSGPTVSPNKLLAWKTLPSRSALSDGIDGPRLSEIESTKSICSEIERMVLLEKGVEAGTTKKQGIVGGGDIISLSDARKSTGLLEQLGYGLKKMIWA
jgi:hypothetical protein